MDAKEKIPSTRPNHKTQCAYGIGLPHIHKTSFAYCIGLPYIQLIIYNDVLDKNPSVTGGRATGVGGNHIEGEPPPASKYAYCIGSPLIHQTTCAYGISLPHTLTTKCAHPQTQRTNQFSEAILFQGGTLFGCLWDSGVLRRR